MSLEALLHFVPKERVLNDDERAVMQALIDAGGDPIDFDLLPGLVKLSKQRTDSALIRLRGLRLVRREPGLWGDLWAADPRTFETRGI